MCELRLARCEGRQGCKARRSAGRSKNARKGQVQTRLLRRGLIVSDERMFGLGSEVGDARCFSTAVGLGRAI